MGFEACISSREPATYGAFPLGFELYSLAYNKKYFDEKALKVPTTLDELAELATKLKDWNGPGSVRSRGQRHPKLGDDPSRVLEQFPRCRGQGLSSREAS